MEACGQFSGVASRHFPASSSLQIPKLPLRSSIFPRRYSSPTCSAQSLSSAGNSFTREVWGVINSRSSAVQRREMRGVVRAEMFGQLTSGLESAWNKLKGEEVLTKENIVEPMRDIRRALLEADVSLPVVRRFVQAVSDQAVGTGLIRGVKPDQQLVKIVSDELVKLMGGEVSELVFSKTKPTVILLAGLQGVGKTTVSAKLALYLKKLGKSCMLIAGDVYRPAAIDQLVILGEQVGVPVYAAGTDVKPAEIARQGLAEAKKKNVDVVIMDTAGRLQIDKAMMDELKDVKKVLDPTEVLLVVDAMTGQEAAALVTTFNVEIGITGAILTKLDGDSRGGAALSVKEVSGKPIKLVGRGERMEDLEPFYPDRMAGRILGMGDVLSFVEKAQEVMKQEEAEDLQKKIMSAKFDFNDFLKQTRAVAKMGSMSRVLGMIPGMGKPQFLSSVAPINKNNFTLSPQYKTFTTIKTSRILSSPNSQSQPLEEDPVKLALAKAKAYRNSVKSGAPTPEIVQTPPEISGKEGDFEAVDKIEDGDVEEDVPLAVKIAMEKANEYQKSKIPEESEGVASKILDAENDKDEGGGKEIPLSVKLALEKTKEYKKNTGVDNGGVGEPQKLVSGLKGGDERSGADKQSIKSSGKKDELKVSSIDFMGLGFADKKSGRGLPAGLVPLSDPFPSGKLPDVEILVGDTSNFGEKSASPVEENDVDLYKPKVSTWGVFPRPNNISKTFGGGRTLRPGEALESAEERAAKDARTLELLAEYKRQFGLNIDPELKSECEKAMKDGDSLMDRGKLREASPFYELVMDKLPFKSELHGLAALQWSICQDSLNRSNEARVMYEKLQSHPSPKVSKKARQFNFGFQAMEIMKVSSMSRPSLSAGYQNFFNAFVQQKTNYPLKEDEVDEGGFTQAIPYFIFLASPIFMVLLIAASKQ